VQDLLTSLNKQLPSAQQEKLVPFMDASFPTTSHEDWKYTSLKKFLPFKLEASPKLEKALPMDLLALLEGVDLLHWVDGELVESNKKTPTGLSISQKQRPWNESTEGLEVLSYMANPQLVEIRIEKNLDRPLVLIHETTHDQKSINGLQLALKLEQNTQADLLFLSIQKTEEFIDSQTLTIDLAANARLHVMDIMLSGPSTRRLATRQAILARDAHLHQLSLMLSGAMTRLNADIKIAGTGAHATVNALTLLKNHEHADFFSTIEHLKEHTTSHQLVKQVLADQSRGVFTGKVHIHPQAQQVSAEQLNKNLLLGEKAQVNTRPQLEVEADDVKCAHGATIGQLSPDELFYLQSRGFDLITAKRMLSHAFVQEVVELFPNTQLSRWLANLIEENLSQLEEGLES
jgi:Fe-S cluster assembly protein SufD